MKGVSLITDEQDKRLELVIQSAEVDGKLDSKALFALIQQSDYRDFFIIQENVLDAVALLNDSRANNKSITIREHIGERKDASIRFVISSDEMGATGVLTNAHGGSPLTHEDLLIKAKHAGIERGLSPKRLKALLHRAIQGKPGEVFEDVIAKGLPPRNGRDSQLKPLVPNALERILRPQAKDDSRVDMRDLGELICVKAKTPVLKRLPPSKGRAGYSITGVPIEPKSGEWIPLVPGKGTLVNPKNENLLIADVAGMPKFKKGQMWVDDTFVCKGVNVGTGNINYDGAVLVNGDVTERMMIKASGDITINGFVESAHIEAGGDIIITEGAMGKVSEVMENYTTRLIAQGSVYLQHGQGISILCKGNVSIGRQLAYSQIHCKGTVTVGPEKKPNGNLFASNVVCRGKVQAGTLGAVSGSQLLIDFSEGFNSLVERKEVVDEMMQQVDNYMTRHKIKIDKIRQKHCPKRLQPRKDAVIGLYEDEYRIYAWLVTQAEKLKNAREDYAESIGLKVSKVLYPGVSVKLNNRAWRSDREYRGAHICFGGHKWYNKT